jgi:transposase
MGMPELIVTAVLTEGRTKSEVARDYGVGRRWVITLVQRYQAEAPDGLQPRSEAPQVHCRSYAGGLRRAVDRA